MTFEFCLYCTHTYIQFKFFKKWLHWHLLVFISQVWKGILKLKSVLIIEFIVIQKTGKWINFYWWQRFLSSLRKVFHMITILSSCLHTFLFCKIMHQEEHCACMGRNELDDLSIDMRILKSCLCRSWTHTGEWGIAPFIIKIDMTCRWMVSFTSKPLYPLESVPVCIE